jgi:hypothetical protein
MVDKGWGWSAEFEESPFDLLPCEVILVKHVRHTLGLSMPLVSHPLIDVLQGRLDRITSPNANDIPFLRPVVVLYQSIYG